MYTLHRGLRVFSNVAELRQFLDASTFDVLSVDFFDTLVYRNCLSPDHIHTRVASSEPGKRAGLSLDWVESRKAAEHRLVKSSPYDETTLSDIYDDLARHGVLPQCMKAELLEQETSEELRSWLSNRRLVELLTGLARSGARVMVTSDTYLPSSVLRPWLAEHQLGHIEVNCSSETRVTKRSGDAFREIRRRYPSAKILHIGDNHTSDGLMALSRGVTAGILQGRGRFASTLPSEVIRLSNERLIADYPSWIEDDLEIDLPCVTAQWAFAWALFCITFIEQVRDYVDRHAIDRVWFVSRDCESLFKCLVESGRMREFPQARYVNFSRVSLAPLASAQQPFSSEATLCMDYIIQQFGSDSDQLKGKLLIVDVGWRGSLQQVLQNLLTDVEVHGYYVSLEPKAAKDLDGRADFMIRWDTGKFSRAMTELMFGFVERGCISYERTRDGLVRPVFSELDGDRSDARYVSAFRRFLLELLESNWRAPAEISRLLQACEKVITRLQIFPRYWEAQGLSGWSIGTDSGGANSSDITGVHASMLTVLAGKVARGNVWPSGALAFRIRNKYAAYALQILTSKARSCLSRAREALSIAPR